MPDRARQTRRGSAPRRRLLCKSMPREDAFLGAKFAYLAMVSLDRGEEKGGLLTDENPHLVRPSYRLLALVRGKGCKWRVSKLALELVAFRRYTFG
jgi:hypothetical protein